MPDPNLRPSQPPARRDVLITLLVKAGGDPRIVDRKSLGLTLRALAQAGQAGADSFIIPDNRRVVVYSMAHLEENGLVRDGVPTDKGREYAEMVDFETRTFISGYVAGLQANEARHQNS